MARIVIIGHAYVPCMGAVAVDCLSAHACRLVPCTHFLGLMRSCLRSATVAAAVGVLPTCHSHPMGGVGVDASEPEVEGASGDDEPTGGVPGVTDAWPFLAEA